MAASGDFDAAAVLKLIVASVPDGRWFKVLQKSAAEEGIASATGIRVVELNALLVNAGVVKEYKSSKDKNAINPRLQKHVLDGILHNISNIKRVVHKREEYICRGDPIYASVPAQINDKKRNSIVSIKLSADIADQLQTSTRLYNEAEQQQKRLEQTAAAKRKRDADAKAAAEVAKKVQFPLLSRLVGNISSSAITLQDEKVKAAVQDITAETMQLLKTSDSKAITYNCPKGSGATLIHVPECSSRDSLLAFDRKTDWTGQLIKSLSRGGTDMAEVIDCIQCGLNRVKDRLSPTQEQGGEPSSTRGALSSKPTNSTSNSDDAPPPKKPRVSQEERRAAGLKLQFPRRIQAGEDISQKKWLPMLEGRKSNIMPRTISNDAKDIQATVNVVSRWQIPRAAAAIAHMLNDRCNVALKPLVLEALGTSAQDKNAALNRIVVKGLSDCIKHHTNEAGGTRTTAAETLVKNLCTGAVFSIKGTGISNNAISTLLGASWYQISYARNRAMILQEQKQLVGPYSRASRKGFIRLKVVPFVFDYCLDDDYTRFDSKQNFFTVINPRTEQEEDIHGRIWKVVGKVRNLELFLESTHCKAFARKHLKSTISYEIWSEALEGMKFVSKPRPESCVDEKVSDLQHAMAAMLGVLKRPGVKTALEGYEGEGLSYDELVGVVRKAGAGKMVEAVCCKKVEQEDLHLDPTKPCPKTIPLKCTHGINGRGDKNPCKCCGIKKSLGILEALEQCAESEETVEVMVWDNAIRQGTNKKTGKQNTQRELTPKTLTIKELVAHFRKVLGICIPHWQEICWMSIIIGIDFSTLPPDTLLIFTDFAAVMILRAFQKKNSSVDGHAVNDNFVCIHSRRLVNVKKTKKVEGVEHIVSSEDIEIFTIDVHHFFAETISKGKKNDHAMHNACLDTIIRHYRKLFRDNGIELKHVIIYTDNAPHQYRCRQTFIKIASVCQRHPGIKITHRLAIVDNFKGYHDSVGKDPAHLIRKLELMSPPIRSPTAEKVFINCFNHLERPKSTWKEYEETGDSRLLNKGRFGMDTRTVWFVVETKEDFDRLAKEYPGRIVLCDRSFILDTKGQKPVTGTTNLHEVRSTATAVPPVTRDTIVWPATVSDLPCNCKHCNKDPDNTLCKYLPWRRTRQVKMVVEELRVGDIEAQDCVGDGFARDIDGVLYCGDIVCYDDEEKCWQVAFHDGDTDIVDDYVELLEGKQLYDASNTDATSADVGDNVGNN